jgi:hypothetical protein
MAGGGGGLKLGRRLSCVGEEVGGEAKGGDDAVRVDDRQAGCGVGGGILQKSLGHPRGVVGGVDAGVDLHALDRSPTREGLYHVVRAPCSE